MDLVSVIITSYCGSKNIRRAILSVLNQTHSNLELIVVDDNDPVSDERKKTEFVMDSIKDERVKYIKHPKNLNGSAARNTGLAAAKGKYIQLLDDDDYLFPDKIALSIQALKKYPDCSMAVTGVIAYGENVIADLSGADKESSDYVLSREWMLRFNAIGTGSNIFATRASVMQIDGFDSSYPRMQDIEFIFRYCQKFKVCAIPDRLIIKDVNDRPAKVKTYKNHYALLSKFFSQFEEEINRLLETDMVNKWYDEQYSHLYRIALMNGTKEDIKQARHNIEKYRSLSKTEKLKSAFPKIWRFLRENKTLRSFVTKRREGTAVRCMFEQQLTDEEKLQVDTYVQKFWRIKN